VLKRRGANAFYIYKCRETCEWPAALVSLSPARKIYVRRMQQAVAQHIRRCRRRAVCMYAKRRTQARSKREREKRRQPFICCLPKWFGPSFSFLHHMLTLRKPLAGWLAALSLSPRAASLVQPPPPRHMPPNTKVGLLIKTEGSVQRVHKSGESERERESCWCEGAEILINALTYVSLCNINNDLATHLPRAAHCKTTVPSQLKTTFRIESKK